MPPHVGGYHGGITLTCTVTRLFVVKHSHDGFRAAPHLALCRLFRAVTVLLVDSGAVLAHLRLEPCPL